MSLLEKFLINATYKSIHYANLEQIIELQDYMILIPINKMAA